MIFKPQTRHCLCLVGFLLCVFAASLMYNKFVLDKSAIAVGRKLNEISEGSHNVESMSAEKDEDCPNEDLRNLRRKGIYTNLRDVNLSRLTTDEMLLTLHSYLDNIEVVCQRKLRMGKLTDGGWEMCDDPPVRPRPPCLVYSFGIQNDFSFDDDIARVYGCHVFSFDPSMKQADDQYNRSELVHFYKIGISESNQINENGWKLFTLSQIRTMLGHTDSVISVLKIDVEGAEWSALQEMFTSGQFSTVNQLLLEFHTGRDIDGGPLLLQKLQTLQMLETAGFRRFYVNKNFTCVLEVKGFPVKRTSCYEVYFVKTK